MHTNTCTRHVDIVDKRNFPFQKIKMTPTVFLNKSNILQSWMSLISFKSWHDVQVMRYV